MTSRRRVRQLLTSYYGIGEGDRQGAGSDDIDGSNFDPEAYVLTLTKDKPLKELLVRENTLSSEIKTLDSEMQMLVYENYNRFISATDTIRKMKTDVEGMQADMGKLSTSIEQISSKSDEVNANLADRRGGIEHLNGVRRLMKKLQFLFELPTRLTRAVELEAYAEAVRYWTTSSAILKQYSHMPAFQAIKSESDTIVDQLKAALRAKVAAPDTAVLELSEAVELLLKLKEPTSDLAMSYFACRSARLQQALDAAPVEATANRTTKDMARATDDADGDVTGEGGVIDDGTVDGTIVAFNSEFLLEAEDFVFSYNNLFLQQPSDTVNAGEGLPDDHAGAGGGADVATAASGGIDTDAGRVQLVKSVNGVFSKYFATVREALLHHTHNTTDLVRDVELWYRDVQRVHRLLPEAGLATEAERIFEEVGREKVSSVFDKLTSSLVLAVRSMGVSALGQDLNTSHVSDDGDEGDVDVKDFDGDRQHDDASHSGSDGGGGNGVSYGAAVSTALDAILLRVQAALMDLQALTVTETVFMARYSRFFTDLIHEDLRELLCTMNTKVFDQSITASATHASHHQTDGADDLPTVQVTAIVDVPVFHLLCCRLWRRLHGQGLQHVMRNLTDNMPVSAAHVDGTDFLLFKPREVTSRLKKAAQHFLISYVELRGSAMGAMIRKSIETPDWFAKKEPREVRMVVDLVLEEVIKANTELTDVTRDDDESHQTRLLGHGGGGAGERWHDRGVDRIFSGVSRTVDLHNVQFHAQSILITIIKLTLKTMMECVRLQRFGRTGFQQIQVDSHFLRLMLCALTSDHKTIDVLIDDIVENTGNRCIEKPVPLDPSIIDEICESKKAKFAGDM